MWCGLDMRAVVTNFGGAILKVDDNMNTLVGPTLVVQ